MFDGLMGGTIFAQADRIVRVHQNHALPHDRGHAHRIACVVGEGQEGAAKRNQATVQGHAVHGGGHAEFAHAIVEITARSISPSDGARPFAQGVVGTREVGGTSE